MKVVTRILFLFYCSIILSSASSAQELDANSIMRKSLDVTKVSGSEAEIELETTDFSQRSRTKRMLVQTKRNAGTSSVSRLARFTYPADFKGTASLSVENAIGDDDIWIYLPNLKKTRRIVSSGRKDRFFGTEFTYGDIVGYKDIEWTNHLDGESEKEGERVFSVTSTPISPRAAEAYGYSKRVTAIRKSDFYPVQIEFWNLDGVLSKVIVADDIRVIGEGKSQAMRITASNLTDLQKSVLSFKSISVVPEIQGDVFSVNRLDQEK